MSKLLNILIIASLLLISIPFVSGAWLNTSYTQCIDIPLHNGNAFDISNFTVIKTLVNLSIQADADDLRIGNNSCGNGGIEIPRDIFWANTTHAEVMFYADCPANSDCNASAYYGNATIGAPVYTSEISIADSIGQPGGGEDQNAGPRVNVSSHGHYTMLWQWENLTGTYYDCGVYSLWMARSEDYLSNQKNDNYTLVGNPSDGNPTVVPLKLGKLTVRMSCENRSAAFAQNNYTKFVNATFFSRTSYMKFDFTNASNNIINASSFLLWTDSNINLAPLYNDTNYNFYSQNFSNASNLSGGSIHDVSYLLWAVSPQIQMFRDGTGWVNHGTTAPLTVWVGISNSTDGLPYANRTGIGIISPITNTTVTQSPPISTLPIFYNITIELNSTLNVSIPDLANYYNSTITRINVNCTNFNVSPIYIQGNVTDREGVRLANTNVTNKTGLPVWGNITTSIGINRSNLWNFSFVCDDGTNKTVNITRVALPNGTLSTKLITPTQNITKTLSQVIPISANSTCSGGECYTVSNLLAISVDLAGSAYTVVESAFSATFFNKTCAPTSFNNVSHGQTMVNTCNLTVGNETTKGDYFLVSMFNISNGNNVGFKNNSPPLNISIFTKGIIPTTPSSYDAFWTSSTQPQVFNNVTYGQYMQCSFTVNGTGPVGNYSLYGLFNQTDYNSFNLTDPRIVEIAILPDGSLSNGINAGNLSGGNYVFRYGPTKITNIPPQGQSLNQPALILCNNGSIIATLVEVNMTQNASANYSYWLVNGSNNTGPVSNNIYLSNISQVVFNGSVGLSECLNFSIFSNLSAFPSGRPPLFTLKMLLRP